MIRFILKESLIAVAELIAAVTLISVIVWAFLL